MDTKIYELADMEIWKRGDRYYVRYDAGAHQIVMREDEISEEEALNAAKGKDEAVAMLFALQKRLIASGIDPYVSNVK
ncbi:MULTISPECIES: hypothetical protein [Paraburkholderia]|jgi:hypothetical protein|uniref:hypothetical protein n=1 Tax=Paraburkholderia TaxID=1822464 RepID=UPI00225AE85D|nr:MULTISPECIES: hypothetical protein [Paraburkholderia]MCX4164575.1 hypothetical protein [Paraburkholderia megapolitana]MDN7160068.1 hypothetical protein [Paraburkholderia sp. CHISQ3]MDQ6497115.1 hypothetical protein [Paraburkholderia megapolitana]